MNIHNPTQNVCDAFITAYTHFNKSIFANSLPDCIIHMHRKTKCYGYFAGSRFGSTDEKVKIDEIALNPSHFKSRTVEQSLSTLVHEMVHLWQHHHGKLSKPGYHNKEWVAYMEDIGLMPSSTGQEGGKKTGQAVSHYIIPNGTYAVTCADLLATGFTLPYVELWNEDKAKKARQAASKTKYCCTACDVNAWAKPDTLLVCGACGEAMEVV